MLRPPRILLPLAIAAASVITATLAAPPATSSVVGDARRVLLTPASFTIAAGLRTREQLAQRRWLRGDVAMVIIGLLILGAIRLVPVIGPIVWGLASIFGVGTALATKFGRREPWFLAWRPSEV